MEEKRQSRPRVLGLNGDIFQLDITVIILSLKSIRTLINPAFIYTATGQKGLF
jgi:hypothetical protein